MKDEDLEDEIRDAGTYDCNGCHRAIHHVRALQARLKDSDLGYQAIEDSHNTLTARLELAEKVVEEAREMADIIYRHAWESLDPIPTREALKAYDAAKETP